MNNTKISAVFRCINKTRSLKYLTLNFSVLPMITKDSKLCDYMFLHPFIAVCMTVTSPLL